MLLSCWTCPSIHTLPTVRKQISEGSSVSAFPHTKSKSIMSSTLAKFTCGHIGIEVSRDDSTKMECASCRFKGAKNPRLKELVRKAYRKLGEKLHNGYQLALEASEKSVLPPKPKPS